MTEDDDDDVGLPGVVWRKKWSVRRVVEQMKQKEIKDMIGASSRSSTYWREYTNTVTSIIRGMDAKTLEDYQKLAEKWNDMGPPPEIQRRYFQKLLSVNVFMVFIKAS